MTAKHKEVATLVPYPLMRRFSIDAGYMGRRRHVMHGLLELDVSEARRMIREQKAQTGETISFTSFLVGCLAKAVEQDKEVQAYLDWRGRLVIYDDVNITVMVEFDGEGGKVVLPRQIHAANRKSLAEIQAEIRAAQKTPARTVEARFMRYFLLLPGFIRHWCEVTMMKHPQAFREMMSPVLVTAVGMFGKGGGWGIPMSNFPLNLTVGGIAEKPGVWKGQIAIRETLCVTLSFDHDIIDGAPAARFTQHFRELVEQGFGLGG